MVTAKNVTFVMPAYNVEKFISIAIESIRNQSITDWRLIVCDDGSSDHTREIVEAFAADDSRIRLIMMPQNSGSAYQPRKAAIEAAETDYVAPLDADDWIEPDYLSKLLSEMGEGEVDNVEAVYPTMADGTDSKILTPLDSSLLHRVFSGKDCVRFTLDGWRINCNGGIISKNLYLRTFNKYDSTVRYSCADELLTRQLLHEAKNVRFSDAEYFYRQNEESITRCPTYKLFEYLINNRTLTDFTLERYGRDSQEYILAQRQNFHGIFDGLRLLNRHSFSKKDKEYAMCELRKARSKIDRTMIKAHVSPRYRLLLMTGLKTARLILRFVSP